MAVQIDLKKSSTIRRDRGGDRYTRIAHITGVTGNVDAVLKTALDDAAMPNYGDPHPNDAAAILQSITVQEQGGGVFRAVLDYYNDPGSQPGAANASISAASAAVSEETQFDINNEPLKTQYLLTSYDPFTAEVERPRVSFDVQYIETSYPRALIDSFQGSINSDAWNGYAPETVLCTSVTVDEQGGADYRVRMEFSYNPDTWKFIARASNLDLPLSPHATNPDAELDHSTGERPFNVYPQIAYAALGITLPGAWVTLTGTAAPSATEAEIVSGGQTIILTLNNETWVAAGATFDAQRQGILDGLVSNKNEATGFNAMSYPVTSVVRTSDTVVTITLAAQGTYAISKSEKITCTVPASALTSSALPFVASQRVTVVAA